MKNLFISFLMLIPLLTFAQLTGYWQTDNGGCYQIRQDGNEVWWAGESPNVQRSTNVFHGYLAGATLTGEWCDMPSNPSNGCSQTLSLRIENNNRMVKVASTAPYNGSFWTKLNGPCTVSITGSGSSSVSGNWTSVHEHSGCTHPEPFCKRYDDMPISFTSLSQGSVEATCKNITLKGTLTGTVYTYQFFVDGRYSGTGQFNFSPDFTSFTGTFKDSYGHRGNWWGKKN